MRTYFKHTSSLLFGVIVSIPLAIYYEISMLLANRGMEADVRNAADVMFKRLFESIGYDGPLAGIIMFAFLFIVAAIAQGAHKEREGIKIHWHFYPVMIAESSLYAMLLFAMMAISMNAMAPAMAISPVDIGYSLGAGVYEELLFRALLLSGLLFLAGKIPGKTTIWKIIAVLISALLFSGAHYIGAAGDTFTWMSFLARTLGGLLLGFVYMLRGLGPVIYTHAIYDIYTILL
ncbi:MAG: CPBP family intramembrane glutamic endopeptidase [Candidatus Marinimicrobia bacterium]|nr:CPBP family intramembrane glutamic endopeptidase [Candidatus Neomarinimicrobiota bacterium]